MNTDRSRGKDDTGVQNYCRRNGAGPKPPTYRAAWSDKKIKNSEKSFSYKNKFGDKLLDFSPNPISILIDPIFKPKLSTGMHKDM